MAANRIGKTEGAGGFEMSLHLIGMYPDWWQGKRFDGPVKCWACGKTNETTRDIVQAKLLGDDIRNTPANLGTGLIPKSHIAGITWRVGFPDLVDRVIIKNANYGNSHLRFKSYEQKRKAFEGTEQDVIWLDEEPPLDIYSECLTRTMTTEGIIMLTFTPLEGMSDVVISYLQPPDESELAGLNL